MVTMPYNFYIQVVFTKEDRLSIRHVVPEIYGFKERDGAGSGRAGPGREYSDFSLEYERTRSARCARSLVINHGMLLPRYRKFQM